MTLIPHDDEAVIDTVFFEAKRSPIVVSGSEAEDQSKLKHRKYWLDHKQLANLLNLNLQHHATVNVNLNLVFVGFAGATLASVCKYDTNNVIYRPSRFILFAGEGNQAFELKDDELKEWFEVCGAVYFARRGGRVVISLCALLTQTAKWEGHCRDITP